jgi:CRISPR/Cas system-associated exonuclease Cas4 (RecB family)
MAELQNDFTWSFSRAQTFAACRRRYWFRYYAFWGGWSAAATPLARKAYFFSKMKSLSMLVGAAVHETIADVLRALRAGREPRRPFEGVRARMNDAWRASREERWRRVGPKQAPPLFEHYYGIPVGAEEIEELREQALRCVRGFLEGDLYREVVKAGPQCVRSIDDLESATIGGVPSFVAPDLAFERGGETWLVDWKTGGEREDHELQLLAYAEHARQKWRLEPEKLRAFDAMLSTGRVVEVPVTLERLAALAEHVRSSARGMLAALEDRERNVARREALPPTDDPRECRRCFFQEICDERPAAAAAASPAPGT